MPLILLPHYYWCASWEASFPPSLLVKDWRQLWSCDNTNVGERMCVLFCWQPFLLLAWSDFAQFIDTEGDNPAIGGWIRTHKINSRGKVVDNQPLRPVHQRALRPAIYKHLLQPKLKICYSSRGWTYYKYTQPDHEYPHPHSLSL